MQVEVLYFAVVRERLGLERESVELPPQATLEALWSALEARHQALGALRPYLRVARNQEFVQGQVELADGDQVALIPPVSGGAPRAWLQTQPLDLQAVEALVDRPEAGAVVSFRGVVRNHAKGRAVQHLEYEVYPEMAQAKLQQVVDEVQQRWPQAQAAVAHRYGLLQVGEDAVIIAVSSPHRAEGFEACRYAIDRIKEIVPIWKKEVGPDGASWVGMGS